METPLTKQQINAGADAHALAVLGPDQYAKNKDARMSIIDDFKVAVEWAIMAMLQLGDRPGDPAHRLITTERLTHQVRGFDAAHDAQYKNHELAVAGILMSATGTSLEPVLKNIPWPIKGYPDKRGKLDIVRERVIGASLIAGEIDLDILKYTSAGSEVPNV